MNTLVKTNRDLFPAIPSLVEDILNRDWFDSTLLNFGTPRSTSPAANIVEKGDQFRIEIAAPGMKRNDFKIELHHNVLTISSQREDSHEEKNGAYMMREFNYQSFERSFTLPEGKFKSEDIKAQYADGILHVTIPKTEEAKVKPAKQIAVA